MMKLFRPSGLQRLMSSTDLIMPPRDTPSAFLRKSSTDAVARKSGTAWGASTDGSLCMQPGCLVLVTQPGTEWDGIHAYVTAHDAKTAWLRSGDKMVKLDLDRLSVVMSPADTRELLQSQMVASAGSGKVDLVPRYC